MPNAGKDVLPKDGDWPCQRVDLTEPTGENGRHHRRGHVLELRECDWRCLICGHWFDAASDADLFWCGSRCKHPGDAAPIPPGSTDAQTPATSHAAGTGAANAASVGDGAETDVAGGREAHSGSFDLTLSYYGECPSCHEVKFIGHGPLCIDCFTETRDGGAGL